ncbi:pilus assembly protein PilP [Janthinobacterium sp. HLX7-2]|uniref:pilus assembly protein PilP n=1 Tax=Janthinobacterium sp. HLX7-2 TaxID=1259331 RepID=UPI003F2642CD
MLRLKKASLWPLPARLASAALTAALVAALLHLAWLHGLLAAVQAAQGEEARLRTTYLQAQARAGRLPGWREQQRRAGAELARLEWQLPNSQQMAALLSDINAAGQSRGVQFTLFKPGLPQPQAYYVALPIAVQLRGAYHAMGELMADLARLRRIVTVHELALTGGKDGMLTLDAVLHAYRLPDAQERAALARVPPLPIQQAPLAWRVLPDFIPLPYAGTALPDPFAAPLQAQQAQQAQQAARGGVAGPDLRRPRAALESVALPALSMVGSVRHAGRLSALLLAGQRVYRVEVGQHLGQDHGVVTAISEQAVQYRELLREADGPWRERRGSLGLQVAGSAGAAAKASLPEAAP